MGGKKIKLNSSSLRLSSVEISDTVVSEIDGNQTMLTIPLDQIVSITLRRGIKSERPLIDILIGATFVAFSVYIFWPLLWDLLSKFLFAFGRTPSPGYMPTRFIVFGLIPLPIGIHLIITALQKRFFLWIATKNGMQRKIVFDNDVTYANIRSFLEKVGSKCGCQITTNIQEK